MIPPTLIRTVPAETTEEVERFWRGAVELHPGWHHVTLRDPLDPADFPLTADQWPRCKTGAQRAGLIRLEAVHQRGGVYLDSDLEVYEHLGPLRDLPFFATWEDEVTVPDFVFGAEAGHPLLLKLIDAAIGAIGEGPWASGPGVFTRLLPSAGVLLLPPASFAPYHYSERHRRDQDHRHPYTFGAHHWAASWL